MIVTSQFIIVASHSNDPDVIGRMLNECGFKGEWTLADGLMDDIIAGISTAVCSAVLSGIDWDAMGKNRTERAALVADLSKFMVSEGAADLRSIDEHIKELREAQKAWYELPRTPSDYSIWLQQKVSFNAVLIAKFAQRVPSANAIIDSGETIHDWIDGAYYSAKTVIIGSVDRPPLVLSMGKPWTWDAERDAEIERLPKDCYLSVVGVDK